METKQPIDAPHIVRNPSAAEILLNDFETRRSLEPFLRRPMTIKEAAEILRESPNTLNYRVKQLEKADLLKVVGHEKTKGKRAKRFGPVATNFIVPFRYVLEETAEKMLRRLCAVDDLIDPNVGKPRLYSSKWSRWGALISASYKPNGKSFDAELVSLGEQSNPIPPSKLFVDVLSSTESAIWSSEVHVELSRDTAKEFQQELAELVTRMKQKQGAAEVAYRVVLTMLPAHTLK